MNKQKLQEFISNLQNIAMELTDTSESDMGVEKQALAVESSSVQAVAAVYNAYDDVHHYRTFSLPGEMSVIVDLLKQSKLCAFSDISGDNTLIGLNISHIYHYNSTNNGYGNGFAINLCEKITSDGVNKYYVDCYGDNYLVHNNIAKNMVYTTTAPASVLGLLTYTYLKDSYTGSDRARKLPTQWLVDVNYVRGFNEEGYLVMINDTYGNHFQINYNSSYKITDVQDLRNNFGVNTFLFTYDTNGNLKQIEDVINDKTVEYTYLNGILQTIEYSNGLSLNIVYSGTAITQVNVSDGYINKISNTGVLKISTQSSLVNIPNGANSENLPSIRSWSFTFGTNETWVEDVDKNLDVYKFATAGYLSAYFRQENSLVIAAEQYEYVPHSYRKTYKAKRDILFTSTYLNFNFSYSEYTVTNLNDYEQPTQIETKNIPMNVGTTADTLTTYMYDDARRCIQEKTITTLHLSASTKTTTHIVDYAYNSNGKLETKSSYFQGEENTKGKIIEEYEYSDEGYLTKVISYNSLEPTKQFYQSMTYDLVGKITGEKNDIGTATTTYNYFTSGVSAAVNKISSIAYPNGVTINYSYDDKGNLSEIYGTSGVENKNEIEYTQDEVTHLTSGDDTIGYLMIIVEGYQA